MRTRLLFLSALFTSLLLTAVAFAAPQTMMVQGLLSSSGGGVAADGVYKMTFSLYTQPKGGATVWTEPALNIGVKGGQFSHVLGTIKPLVAQTLASMPGAYLGVKVGDDPELPRTAIHTVLWASVASVAATVKCSGCLGAGQLAQGAVTADKVAFAWAGSKTKGGPAKLATDLQCTGCVSVSEMKFDAGLDLGGNALKAKSVVSATVSAGTVSANTFVGDGSKLTGIKIPTGTCAKQGEVVKGVKADGTLICVPAMAPAQLPADGIDEISNNLIYNQFVDTVVSKTVPVPIPDNNPKGVYDSFVFPDLGLAQKLTVNLHLVDSDISQVTVTLFAPDNSVYVLYKENGKGTVLKTSWPTPSKLISGKLGDWVGKNPKGKWKIFVKDEKFLNNKFDGEIKSWGITIQTLSNKKIQIKGNLLVDGSVKFGNDTTPCSAINAGSIRWNGTVFQGCNGNVWTGLQGPDGNSKSAAALACKQIKAAYPLSPDGVYWIDPNGGGTSDAFQAYCDMSSHGGGWTLVINLDTNDGANRHYFDTNFWVKPGWYAGSVSSALTGDYKGPSYDKVSGTELMIKAHIEGSTKGTAYYNLLGAWSKHTMAYLFAKANNSTVTGTRVASTGSIGSAGHKRNAGDSFIDHSEPLIFNSRYYISSNDDYTRVGTNYSKYCGIINCNGHNYSGLGGRHHNSGWGAYYEAAQINGYCDTQGLYGSDASGYSSNNAAKGCGYKTRDMDFALWIR